MESKKIASRTPLAKHILAIRMEREMLTAEAKEFNQAGCQHGGTVLKNDRRYSIRYISLLRVKAREGVKNIIRKNFDIRHK